MIGSCTLLVRENGLYKAHICGAMYMTFAMWARAPKPSTPGQIIRETLKLPAWRQFDAIGLTEDDVKIITHPSCHCAAADQPFYHRLAGDAVYIWDVATERLFAVRGDQSTDITDGIGR